MCVAQAAENAFVRSVYPTGILAVGGFRETPSAAWQWTTGDAFDYTNWATGQPDDGVELVIAVVEDGTWHDYADGTASLPAICEMDVRHPCGTPTPYDDLQAACSAAGHTYIAHGSTGRGGCYAYSSTARDQPAAHAECQGLGGGDLSGGLAVMNDAAENTAVFGGNSLIPAGQHWFALRQIPRSIADEPDLAWTNFGGCASVFQSWGANEPNNAGTEDCTHSLTNGAWNGE